MATVNLGQFDTGVITPANFATSVARGWGYKGPDDTPSRIAFLRQRIALLLREAYRSGEKQQIVTNAETNLVVPDITPV
jgi:hypothetical protein